MGGNTRTKPPGKLQNMKKWVMRHPKISTYILVSLLFVCIISFALYAMTERQLRLTGAAEEQQFFELCRSHADKGLELLQNGQYTGEAAHNILSAAEYLELYGENGLEAAQKLRESGNIILDNGKPDTEITHILEILTEGRIPYVPHPAKEKESADTLRNPYSLIQSEQKKLAEKCTGISGGLTEVSMPEDTKTSVYVCRNLYLVLAARGYPLEYSIYLPYQGEHYGEEACRQAAIRWIRINIPRDILGTEAEIENCEAQPQGYRMSVRCKKGLMDIYIRNDNSKVGWFDGKMLEI